MYDIENFLVDIQTQLKHNSNGINAQLTAIATDKNDSITVASIDDANYFVLGLTHEALNCNPFIHIDVIDVDSQGIGPTTAVNYIVEVSVCVEDSGQDSSEWKRALRYWRALRQCFEGDQWTAISQRKVKVSSLIPVNLGLLNSANPYRVVGITLEVSLV